MFFGGNYWFLIPFCLFAGWFGRWTENSVAGEIGVDGNHAGTELTILCSSDLHGNIFGESPEDANMLKMASVIRKVRQREAREGRDILLLDCGDLISGSFEASLNPPDRIADFLNQMQYDAIVPGNHDLERGMTEYRQFCRKYHQGHVLAANLQSPSGEYWQSGWKMIQKNQYRIAVIGCTSPYLDQWLSVGQMESWKAEALIPALERLMPEIMAENPDLILLMLHHGEFVPERLNPDLNGQKDLTLSAVSRRFPQIRLIFGGHSHIAEAGKRLYPLTWFVQAPPHGEGILQVELRRNPDKTWQIRSGILPVKQEKNDLQSLKLFADWQKKMEDGKQNQLAVLPEKTTLFSLLDHAVKSIDPELDLVLWPKSENRRIGKGTATLFTLYQQLPYENRLCTLKLDRSQFSRLIKEQEKMKNKENVLTASGKKLSLELFSPGPDGRIKVAVSSYIAAGGGGRYPLFRIFCRDPLCCFTESSRTVRDLLLAYWQKKSVL